MILPSLGLQMSRAACESKHNKIHIFIIQTITVKNLLTNASIQLPSGSVLEHACLECEVKQSVKIYSKRMVSGPFPAAHFELDHIYNEPSLSSSKLDSAQLDCSPNHHKHQKFWQKIMRVVYASKLKILFLARRSMAKPKTFRQQ